jgi:hypothetical protein
VVNNPYKEQYYQAVRPQPVWPMQPARLQAIYGTMQRTIRDASDQDKARLRQALAAIAGDFGARCRQLTGHQAYFDRWFDRQVTTLQRLPFRWRDAGGNDHAHLTFGLIQKFLNLMLKDWWCVSAEAEECNVSVLHAPFDRVVWNRLWTLTRFQLPSLNQGGYSVYLSRSDYDRYQQHLLSAPLQRLLSPGRPLIRLEAEQALWHG